MLTVYFVTVTSRELVELKYYSKAAQELVSALQTTLGDITKLRQITHVKDGDPLTGARVEVEVTQAEPTLSSPIVARAVVQADLPKRMTFDKNLFTSMLRDELTFPFSVTKRAVARDEVPEA